MGVGRHPRRPSLSYCVEHELVGFHSPAADEALHLLHQEVRHRHVAPGVGSSSAEVEVAGDVGERLGDLRGAAAEVKPPDRRAPISPGHRPV